MRIPVIPLNRVLHIGTMDPSDLGSNHRSSLEGNCLSVSLCPHTWGEIAEINGELHELSAGDGLFLDMHAVARDEDLRAGILEWAEEEGLVADREVWKFWWRDPEFAPRWQYEYRPTLEAAFKAVKDDGPYASPEQVKGPKGCPGIEAVTMPVATPKLQAVSGMKCLPFQPDQVQVDPGCHLDAVLMAWAIEVAPTLLGRPLDGVWWRERYSPERLSAPRGGIFPERVESWASCVVDMDSLSDRRELKAMPRTELVDAERTLAPTT